MNNRIKGNSINKIYDFDYKPYKKELTHVLNDLHFAENLNPLIFDRIVSRKIKGFSGIFSKQQLIKAYKGLKKEKYFDLKADDSILEKIKMKPSRTSSGVTPVTVLTKPFPCPGQCIFCPSDTRMPKSYLINEPGAQRAFRNDFDPYLQTYDRLRAFQNIGHNTDKIELIILGGTWSVYPETYQIWFIKRCFEAMNDFGEGIDKISECEYKGLDKEREENFRKTGKIIAENNGKISYNKLIFKINKNITDNQNKTEQSLWEELFKEHEKNVVSKTKCIGLVIETRPDCITQKEIIRIRKFGATKIQIGWQFLDDEILEKNKRGHNLDDIIKAVKIIRLAGFKIHAHWMANLYGSSVKKDIKNYKKIFEDENFKPDELKVYPCSLLEFTELYKIYLQGLWKPYSTTELKKVLIFILSNTPEYCRLSRIIRDIPSDDIITGNKITNLREIVEKETDELNLTRNDIRAREIRDKKVNLNNLKLKIIKFKTSCSEEYFLQYVNSKNKIAGFLRLSLLNTKKHKFIKELDDCVIIREIHIYGIVINIGEKKEQGTQHLGLGKKLIKKAEEIAKKNNWKKIAVISGIGTRDYYTKRGFKLKELYQIKNL